MSALAGISGVFLRLIFVAGHLVRSHLIHNRKAQKTNEGDVGHTLAGLNSKDTN
jgi:hypothetical protein